MKTANELTHLAERYGWKVGPLTYAQVQKMNSQEYEFHQVFNKTEIERALSEPQVRKQTEQEAVSQKANRHKSRTATPEDLKAAEADCRKFANDYPQLIQDSEQNQVIMRWIFDQNLPIEYKTLVRAFETLTHSGELLLNPSAIGAGSETEVTGHKLRTHPNLWKLLAPYNAETREKYELEQMSAKEFAPIVKEAFRNENGPSVDEAKIRKDVATFLSFHPEYLSSDKNQDLILDWLAKRNMLPTRINFETAYQALRESGEMEIKPGAGVAGQVQKMIDFGAPRTKGVPPRSKKSSFQSKINSMTSIELKEKIATDPEFRAALDGLG